MKHYCRAGALALSSVLLLATGCGKAEEEAATNPLDAIFGEQLSPAEDRARQLEIEEATAQCMKDLGWEYVPVDWSAQVNDQQPPEQWGTPEFGKKYGYGIVYQYETYELPNLDENGNWTENVDEGTQFVDPNADYVSSLTPEENERYYADLYGEQIEVAPTTDDVPAATVVETDPENAGCNTKAYEEVYGDQPWDDQEFNDRMQQVYEDLENDPRILDAEELWGECMYDKNADYDFYEQEETYQYMEARLNEAKGLERMEVDAETGQVIGGTGDEIVNGWSEDIDGTAWGYVGQQKKLTDAQLTELRETELEMWTVDQDCLDESGLKDVNREVQEEMVDLIRDEFPQYVQDGGDA